MRRFPRIAITAAAAAVVTVGCLGQPMPAKQRYALEADRPATRAPWREGRIAVVSVRGDSAFAG